MTFLQVFPSIHAFYLQYHSLLSVRVLYSSECAVQQLGLQYDATDANLELTVFGHDLVIS